MSPQSDVRGFGVKTELVNLVSLYSLSLLLITSPTPLHRTYMHLRIELLCRRRGRVGPGYVLVRGHITVTVGRVPVVVAGGPGQGGPKR